MLWVLWDIFLPLIAAFLVGLLIGWMLWRWRRSRIDADALHALKRKNLRLKADTDDLRIRNAELSDKLQVASVAGQRNPDTSAMELARSRKRIEVLSEELKSSRQQIDKLRKDNAQADGVNRVRELEAKLRGAQRRIEDLQKNDLPYAGQVTDHDNVHEAIRARDQMIETLRTSLEQFGETKDKEALEATLALRERKIEALEKMLEDANQQGL